MDEEFEGQETDIEDAIDAFMREPEDDENLSTDDDSEESTEETTEVDEDSDDQDEEGDDTDPDESDDSEEDKEAAKAKEAEDDAEVSVTVEGTEHRVSVKDLKRLFGQEAALTQKSQAIAAQRRALDDQGLYLAKILDTRHKEAQAKVAKYKDVDLFRASRELDADDFDALRAAKEGAESELKAIEREGQEFVQRAQQVRTAHLREQAKESLKVITKAIPDWNDDVYSKVSAYAVSQGMDADTVGQIVDASAIIMMHKAWQFDQAQSKKETVQKKISKTPKKVLKSSGDPADRATSKIKALRRDAANSGDVDDVAALFLAAQDN
jgi:hypothetical protein